MKKIIFLFLIIFNTAFIVNESTAQLRYIATWGFTHGRDSANEFTIDRELRALKGIAIPDTAKITMLTGIGTSPNILTFVPSGLKLYQHPTGFTLWENPGGEFLFRAANNVQGNFWFNPVFKNINFGNYYGTTKDSANFNLMLDTNNNRHDIGLFSNLSYTKGIYADMRRGEDRIDFSGISGTATYNFNGVLQNNGASVATANIDNNFTVPQSMAGIISSASLIETSFTTYSNSEDTISINDIEIYSEVHGYTPNTLYLTAGTIQPGKVYWITNTDSQALEIDGNGRNINNITRVVIPADFAAVRLKFNGTRWIAQVFPAP